MRILKTKPEDTERKVLIRADHEGLEGELVVPVDARAIVLFAHGSGSSRLSPRNRYVSGELNKIKVATLLLDLLTLEEEDQDMKTGQFRFNIDLLAQRLVSATKWIKDEADTKKLGLGYFGASTGAAAALVAAAKLPAMVRAIVLRGGRPDLAEAALPLVKAPTLLLVGSRDTEVIAMNESALEKLIIRKELVIMPQASHLFEEPGALEEVARLAAGWFGEYL